MSKSKKTRWGRVAAAWILCAVFVFVVVPYKRLPEQLRNNALVSAAYELKDGSSANKAASVEPAAGEAGYKSDDRRELDSLISRGTYNE